MNLQIRGKHGQAIRVLNEHGVDLEGVVSVEIRIDGKGIPSAVIEVRPVAVVLDVEAEVKTLPPAAPATEKSTRSESSKGKKD